MMPLRHIALCFVILMAPYLMAHSARADSSCDKPRNGFDGIYCLSKVYQQSDADLNAAFTQLDGPGRDALRTSQIAWLQLRDQDCSKHDPSGFYVNLACATRMTISRTEFLQSRYRKCISSGCMNSRLK